VRGDRIALAQSTPVALIQPKRLALLLYLALAEPHSRDTLVTLLWPDAEPTQRATLFATDSMGFATAGQRRLCRGVTDT